MCYLMHLKIKNVKIACVDQSTSSMRIMPAFDGNRDSVQSQIVNMNHIHSFPTNVDFTGKRVDACFKLIETTNVDYQLRKEIFEKLQSPKQILQVLEQVAKCTQNYASN